MSDPFDLAEPNTPSPSPVVGTPYLDGLNEGQREAVEAIDGPHLVLAGAGTGKTRVLTTRLAHILIQGKARHWQVLAVTFTNKAAREMRERVGAILGTEVENWWVGTFHALCVKILRKHAAAVGLSSNFTILDDDDQVRLIKQLLDVHGIDEKKTPARAVLSVIQRWKDRGLTPDKVTGGEGSDAFDGQALSLYEDYQARLQSLNAADFGDLLLHCLTLLQNDAEVLAKYRDQFRYIMVDEYQDTNVAQYLWLRLLAGTGGNICCVGDDDQSIYSWRGAEVENILRFEKDFPGAHVVRLERNYRSTPNILGAASGLIANNDGRLGKTLWTEGDAGDKVVLNGVWDGAEEARYIGGEIEVLHSKKHKLNQIAILVRAGFQTREFEERLITLGVPYRVIGGQRFYERQEIRDAIAYLRVIWQPNDDLAFERIVNVPKRGIGKATLQTVHILARSQRISLSAAVAQLVETDELKAKARNTLANLMVEFERWRSLLEGANQGELMAEVLDQSGYIDMWRASRAPDAPGRIDNLKELVAAMDQFDSLEAFLEHVSLVMENDEAVTDDKVNLMTLHGAKGLEFETVFLPGWEEGLFPHQRALDEGGTGGLEEERRLAYVGLTRARARATICFAANRRIYGQWQSAIPSRFIDELPEEYVRRSAAPGLYGYGGGLGEGGSRGAFRDGGASFGGNGGARRQRRAGLIDDAGWRTESGAEERSKFDLGQRVFHQKFGYGRIVAIQGNKLEIDFEHTGIKKVVDSFVDNV
ncbi:MAG: UvrD-helicase domain-containing protein [Rhodospirillales bacterium]|jgi:DNA helicase II / ATP-dependent DNA helicase PcrA|nr:UvrD-helicase domain-containing protein [Rhodospirillales bacterium]